MYRDNHPVSTQEALDCLLEHLMVLNAKTDIYEDDTWKVILVLEERVVPMLRKEIEVAECHRGLMEAVENWSNKYGFMQKGGII